MFTIEKAKIDKNPEEEQGGKNEDDSTNAEKEPTADNKANNVSSKENSGGDVEGRNASKHNNINLEIMIKKKLVDIEDLPQIGGQKVPAYGDVMMPAKLYATKTNIQSFIESELVEDWNITHKWWEWLKKVDLKSAVEKKEVVSLLRLEMKAQKKNEKSTKGGLQISFSTANSIFADYDGKKKKQNDLLSRTDRAFLHLLVGADEFGDTKTPDLAFYLKESCCHYETVRLIQKFDTEGKVDVALIEHHWNPRPNRRFCEILIFISQFFGRAEHVMMGPKVQELWNSLPFVHHFVKALVDQCEMFQEKNEKKVENTRDTENVDSDQGQDKSEDDRNASFESEAKIIKKPEAVKGKVSLVVKKRKVENDGSVELAKKLKIEKSIESNKKTSKRTVLV
jgi:hypothetical protein